MNITDIQNLIIHTLQLFGFSVLVIIGTAFATGVAYLIFDFGWKTIIQDRTSIVSSKIMFLDHTPFVKPYKSYNRLRSKDWNINHTM